MNMWAFYWPLRVLGFPGGSESKVSVCSAGDLGSIPGSGRSPGEGNGTPLQYSCLENPMDRRAWGATFHGVAKSRTRLSDFTFTFPGGASGKGPTWQCRRHKKCWISLIPGCGRSPGGEHGNPLQYSCLENPMNRECLEGSGL